MKSANFSWKVVQYVSWIRWKVRELLALPSDINWWFYDKFDPVNEKAIWVWRGVHWDEIEVSSFQIDKVLCASGIVDSRSSAQRLIKEGGVSWRRDNGREDWEKVRNFSDEIPAGHPYILRIGNGLYRTILVNGKFKQAPSLATVMRPMWVEGVDSDKKTTYRVFQSRRLWNKLWR